jgi:hypothetical protein
MPEILSFVGAFIGVVGQMFTNSLRKLPLTRYPYMHVALGVTGFYFLPWYDRKVEDAKLLVEKKNREKMERNVTF